MTVVDTSHNFALVPQSDLLGLGSVVITSATRTELVEALAPGYAEVEDNHEALEARWEFAIGIASTLQARLLEDFEGSLSNGVERSIADFDEDTITCLMQSRERPVTHPETWNCPVPFVGLATDYEPVTRLRLPVGNVIIIDPMDERTLLESMEAAGLLMVMVRGEEA